MKAAWNTQQNQGWLIASPMGLCQGKIMFTASLHNNKKSSFLSAEETIACKHMEACDVIVESL